MLNKTSRMYVIFDIYNKFTLSKEPSKAQTKQRIAETTKYLGNHCWRKLQIIGVVEMSKLALKAKYLRKKVANYWSSWNVQIIIKNMQHRKLPIIWNQ